MDSNNAPSFEDLSLLAAVSIAYHQVMDRPYAGNGVLEMNATFERVARAITALVPIHAIDAATGKRVQILPAEARECTFAFGAAVVVSAGGKVRRRVRIRRNDLAAAIEALKRARSEF